MLEIDFHPYKSQPKPDRVKNISVLQNGKKSLIQQALSKILSFIFLVLYDVKANHDNTKHTIKRI
jgi:hypothetical protein